MLIQREAKWMNHDRDGQSGFQLDIEGPSDWVELEGSSLHWHWAFLTVG
jgi:hypothetical protein